jgi:hypothetical protein
MAGPPPPPDPSGDDPAVLADPDTGEPLPTADLREEFARLSREAPDEPGARRAFLEARLGMIEGDPRLSDEEKRAAVAEVLERFRGGD